MKQGDPTVLPVQCEQAAPVRSDVNYRPGLFLAITISLLLHCSAFSMVWYCTTQTESRSCEIVFETVQLGNIGGNPGSVQGQKEAQENAPEQKKNEAAEHSVMKGIEQSLVVRSKPDVVSDELTEPLISVEEKEEPRKVTLSSVLVKQFVNELKKSIPEQVKELPTAWSLPQVKIPDLLATNSDLLQYRWKDAEAKVAGLVAAVHRKHQEDKKREQEKVAAQEPVRGVKEEMADKQASEKVAVEKGNAPTSGNNRSGIGNAGSGGNNNGETRPASAIPELCLLPPYPFEAYRRNQQGVVTVSFRCLGSGQVTDVKVIKSSGSAILDEAAVAAVEKWKLNPALALGVPYDVTLTKEIGFRIE